ncbi:TPA: hypothetical protein UL935_002803 [Stenotrophomonas maltophilia]|nr:hypothetical protein [Stenotrophomonas maltophilia]
MSELPEPSSGSEHLRLLADLCMVAQGFHPSRCRADELIADGLIWVLVAKPPKHGLTALGRTTLISLVFQGTSLDPSELADAAKHVDSAVTAFAAGTALLDELETQAREGNRVMPTVEQGGILIWRLSRQPSEVPTR